MLIKEKQIRLSMERDIGGCVEAHDSGRWMLTMREKQRKRKKDRAEKVHQLTTSEHRGTRCSS